MKEQLGWNVVYRTMWNSAWPTEKTDECFPNVKRDWIDRYDENDPLRRFLVEHSGGRINEDFDELFDSVTFNDLEPDKYNTVTDSDRANKVTLEWIKELGEKAKVIKHLEYPLQEFHVDRLVEELKSPHSKVRVLQLEAFFIQ
jgi:hypothetical protein